MPIGPCQHALDLAAWAAKEQRFKENAWGQRHFDAWFAPRVGWEQAVVVTLKGLAVYADAHAAAYGTPLGADGVCGRYWLDSVVAFLRLRDGEHGRFDAGALGDAARAMVTAAGYDNEECEEIG